MSPEESSAGATKPWLNAQGSRYLLDWLAEQRVSLAFTTYQTGKLFFVGRKQNNSIAIFERTFGHCMGMWASPCCRECASPWPSDFSPTKSNA